MDVTTYKELRCNTSPLPLVLLLIINTKYNIYWIRGSMIILSRCFPIYVFKGIDFCYFAIEPEFKNNFVSNNLKCSHLFNLFWLNIDIIGKVVSRWV